MSLAVEFAGSRVDVPSDGTRVIGRVGDLAVRLIMRVVATATGLHHRWSFDV